ncbi:MAG: hypothetical protein AAF416_22040 [Pseudomonadota bacterium]
MTLLRFLTLAFVGVFATAAPAGACSFHPGETADQAGAEAPLHALGAGITRGWMRCPGEADRPLVVWTLQTDDGAEWLGVRDAPLFISMPQNPFVRVAALGYRRDSRFNLFVRAEHETIAEKSDGDAENPTPPYRVFGTLCSSEADDALNCSLGAQRLKARTDMRDSDGDGVLDLARHELSIYTPGRLQVLRFAGTHETEPRRIIAQWIGGLSLAGL